MVSLQRVHQCTFVRSDDERLGHWGRDALEEGFVSLSEAEVSKAHGLGT